MKKKALLAAVCVGVCVAVFGQNSGDAPETDFTTENAESLAVYGDFGLRGTALVSYTGEEEDVVIPANLGITEIAKGVFHSGIRMVVIPDTVTTIGDWAFANCRNLTAITIPNSVTTIGDEAFHGCGSLTAITIPGSVTSIGAGAFSYCSRLTAITIPNSVTAIGYRAFYDCSQLSEISVDDRNAYYSSVNGILFNKNKTELVQYLIGKNNTEYIIPKSVTSIGDGAFSGCDSLTSITIPNSVTSIGFEAFRGCQNLTSITIPGSVTSIGEWAFFGCDGLTSITIPNSVTSIGERAFYCCFSLTSITIPNSVTAIGDYAFSGCKNLTGVSLSRKTKIGDFAFEYTPAIISYYD
jgi:hypothetical protein